MAGFSHQSVDRTRRAGVLLHPTSLPGPLDYGDIGHQAYRFIEFLSSCGFKVWQMLPIGPTHSDRSPYQCLSSHAGNPLLISLDWLVDKGWLNMDEVDVSGLGDRYRISCLKQAAESFYQLDDKNWTAKIKTFIEQHKDWLTDYALFMALKIRYQDLPWYEWPDSIRHRDVDVMQQASSELEDEISTKIFEQFVFYQQWNEIKKYARQHGIELFGDMPIFVARDSADVWAQRDNFLMNNDGEMEFISGVPPDAFSETGQRWGNPLYDWEYMLTSGFEWWKNRFKTQFELFDIIRVDHFRGLQACWQIPEKDDTAINGKWVTVPGKALLDELFDSFHHLPVVAEDLGVITDEVTEMKNEFNLPGMKVLHFAFDGNSNNPHLPHRHYTGDVIYTGTHDNDTTRGWLDEERNYKKYFLHEYSDIRIDANDAGVMSLIRMALSSVSFLCILPMQDILLLDSAARMNTPGTVGDNWQWRFDWEQVENSTIGKITRFITLYQR